jgi:hypothetical protein
MIQKTWLQSSLVEMDGRSDSDIPAFGYMPHCSLFMAVRPEQANSVSPFLSSEAFFRGIILWLGTFFAR